MATEPTIFKQTRVEKDFKKINNFPVHLPESTTNNTCTYNESCLQVEQDEQLSRRNSSRRMKSNNSILPENFFLIAYILKKNKVRPRVQPQTLGYKGNGVKPRPSGKEPGGCEGSLKKQVEETLERLRKSSRIQDTC